MPAGRRGFTLARVEYTGHSLTERATTLPGRYYTSAEIFAAEQERDLFAAVALRRPRRGDREPGDFVLVGDRRRELLLVAVGIGG